MGLTCRYVVSALAIRRTLKEPPAVGENIEIVHFPLSVMADSVGAATRKGLEECEERYPVTKGWCEHRCEAARLLLV